MSPSTPITDAPVTRIMPVLINKPITIAKGIVAAIVKSPHGLSAKALTTTKPNTASKIVMIANSEIIATKPTNGCTSSLSI